MTTAFATTLPTVAATLGPKWFDPQYLLNTYGLWLAVVVVFIECGLLWPILPGDSLLFMVGFFAASGLLKVNLIGAVVILIVAAFLGNVSGYWIGRGLGVAIYERDWRFLKREWFDRSHAFFEKYGNKALVIGRFVPIVRTFITLVAGVSKMSTRRFFTWSAVGAVMWVILVTYAGYFLGNVSFVKNNLEASILVLVIISMLPMAWEWWRHRKGLGTAVDEVG